MGIGALCAVVPVAFGSYETGKPVIERRELRLPNWDADGFKVGFIADLHVNSARQMQHALFAVNAVLAEKPDVILLGGDFVNASETDRLEHIGECLAPLAHSPVPVLAVMGNHDYYCNDPRKAFEAIHSAPLRLLRNEAVEVDGVTIAGIDDALAYRHHVGFIEEGTHSKSLIALFHEPDFVTEVPKKVSIQLSGHSHGGQVCLPSGRALHTPTGAKKYISGFYPDAEVPLYVTRGVGTSGPEWRMFCPPEISILTLRGT